MARQPKKNSADITVATMRKDKSIVKSVFSTVLAQSICNERIRAERLTIVSEKWCVKKAGCGASCL